MSLKSLWGLLPEIEHSDAAVCAHAGEHVPAAPRLAEGDVIHLLVMGDQLGLDVTTDHVDPPQHLTNKRSVFQLLTNGSSPGPSPAPTRCTWCRWRRCPAGLGQPHSSQTKSEGRCEKLFKILNLFCTIGSINPSVLHSPEV